jgi:microcystin-dependent protein
MDPFVGEIRAVGFNYAPQNWAFCQGQTLAIRQYTALFSLLGTTYGGDGRTTFCLPDLRGRTIVHLGQGAGLSSYSLGQAGGATSVTLQPNQLPVHTHGLSTTTVAATTNASSSPSPAGNILASGGSTNQYGEESTSGNTMAVNMVSGTASTVGGGGAHENQMPFLAVNYIIALQGIFPSRP